MAEAAGLAFGSIGLASLFATSIECLDYITLARNHGNDFEVALVKIQILNCRLNVWGKSLSVATPGRELPLLRNEWDTLSNTIGRSLVGIRNCFNEKSLLEKRYGLKPVEENWLILGTTHTRRPFEEIEAGFEIDSRRRQRETAFPKKVWWAIHDKKKFDALVADVAFFVENLERLSDRLNATSTQERLLKAAIARMQSPNIVQLLDEAERSMPPQSAPETADETGGGKGHVFLRTAIKDQAKFLMGDVGLTAGKQHPYEDTEVMGSAMAIGGNVTPDAMERFFR